MSDTRTISELLYTAAVVQLDLHVHRDLDRHVCRLNGHNAFCINGMSEHGSACSLRELVDAEGKCCARELSSL